MRYPILGLDVSSSKTGWCLAYSTDNFIFGDIPLDKKLDYFNRIIIYYSILENLLKTFKPKSLVLESVFTGPNKKVAKVLYEFSAATKLCCYFNLKTLPIMVDNKTVKAYFSVKKKQELFYKITELLNIKDLTYEDGNDMMDSIALVMYYIDKFSGKPVYKIDDKFII